ncbi:MAG: hypothetical protein AAF517_13765, partial [Planctomycetota bacterium]
SCRTTTLEFRSPKGSFLDLEANWPNEARRVQFLSRVKFSQVDDRGATEGTSVRGEIRIDGEIDLTRIPPGSESYFVKRDGHTYLLVHGFYWIYKYEKTTRDELTVHYVDVLPESIYRLLGGDPVIIRGRRSGSGVPVFKFELGVQLPPENESPPANTAIPVPEQREPATP